MFCPKMASEGLVAGYFYFLDSGVWLLGTAHAALHYLNLNRGKAFCAHHIILNQDAQD